MYVKQASVSERRRI